MKLSQETVIGLKRLCSVALISDTDFQNLLTDCAQSIALEEAIVKREYFNYPFVFIDSVLNSDETRFNFFFTMIREN